MTDADTEAAVAEFLRAYDSAMSEYEAGYADADATLRLVNGHVDELRDAVED